MNLLDIFVGLLGRELIPLPRPRTVQYRQHKNPDVHICFVRESNLRSQCSSGTTTRRLRMRSEWYGWWHFVLM